MLDFISACIHLDPIGIIKTGSYFGLAFIIFAESGLLVGVFFPGDSLLFAAGLLSAAGFLLPLPLVITVVLAAIIGDSVGYWFGANVGTNLFNKKDTRFFKQEYLVRTKAFYKKYGGRAVVLARFVPIIRTMAPILAGVGGMKYRAFLGYNMLGGFLWGAGMVMLGFFLGTILPGAEHYILPLSLLIIVISFFPIVVNVLRGRRAL